MKKVFSTICGFFPIYPKMPIKFPIPRAPGLVPKMAVTALVGSPTVDPISFFGAPAHICAVTCMSEISLIATLSNQLTFTLY